MFGVQNKKINQGTTVNETHTLTCTNGLLVFIDAENYLWLSCFVWRAYRKQKSWYARTSIFANGKTRWVYMHRMVAKTPLDQVCHHRNRNSLDNHIKNLLNMSKKEHQFLHINNTLTIKFENKSESRPDGGPI